MNKTTMIENLQARYLFAFDFDALANMPGGRHHITNLVLKIDGEWLFETRRIYNEGNEAWAAPPGNPAW